MGETSHILFEKTSVPRAFFALTIPNVLNKIVMLLYNMADTFFIARTGNTALVAGVSLVAPVFMVMIAMGDIFGIGGSSLISRLLDRARTGKPKASVHSVSGDPWAQARYWGFCFCFFRRRF